MGAASGEFDDAAADRETPRRGRGLKALEQCRRVEFLHQPAGLADQHGGRLAVMRVGAGHEGVTALDLVHKAMRLEEIQRPVNCRRLGCAFAVEIAEQVIGL